MPKVSRISSKYHFTKEEAKLHLSEEGVDHILRMSAIDLVKTMPIEDLKKVFHVQQKDPVPFSKHITNETVYEHEIVVSIAIKD